MAASATTAPPNAVPDQNGVRNSSLFKHRDDVRRILFHRQRLASVAGSPVSGQVEDHYPERVLERFYLVFPEPPMDSPPVHQDERGIALTMYLVVDRNAVSSVRRISVHRSDAATWGTHLARLRVLVSAAGEQEADRDGR